MRKILKNPTARVKARWVIIIVGALFMALGIKYPVPLVAMKTEIVNNTFLWTGFIGVMLGMGAIEILKVWKGKEEK